MGGQCSDKDPQEGPQDPWHPMEIMDTTSVLDLEFGLKTGLEGRMENQVQAPFPPHHGSAGRWEESDRDLLRAKEAEIP